jgi:hypothetical protein
MQGDSDRRALPPGLVSPGPQLALLLSLSVEMGNIKAPSLCMVEAKRKAKWPLRGQATEQKRGPDRLPQEA